MSASPYVPSPRHLQTSIISSFNCPLSKLGISGPFNLFGSCKRITLLPSLYILQHLPACEVVGQNCACYSRYLIIFSVHTSVEFLAVFLLRWLLNAKQQLSREVSHYTIIPQSYSWSVLICWGPSIYIWNTRLYFFQNDSLCISLDWISMSVLSCSRLVPLGPFANLH